MTIDGQKSYFFSVTVEGMLAYTVVNNVLVGCGDIVCDPKDAARFMGELVHFHVVMDGKSCLWTLQKRCALPMNLMDFDD